LALEAIIKKHYRDRLAPADLADPALLVESRTALAEIGEVLKLGPVHDFQSN
jgi:succinylarginine dihydrolase